MKRSLILALGIAAILVGEIQAQAVSGLKAITVASGLTQPLFVTAPPGDFNELFIVEQTGQIVVLNLQTGAITPFLDIHSRLTATDGEQGLLGLAFDPDYASNGKFYVNYTIPGGFYGSGTTIVSQIQAATVPTPTATPTATPKKKKKKSKHSTPTPTPVGAESVLLRFDHPQPNHNGGWIGFSPRAGDDHNLYIATGDGGNFDDQGPGHIEPGGNSQNTMTLLGKMLRIHVDPATGLASIPADNPFVGMTSRRQEIWAYGLRNPFRDSFDRQTGVMFIGDVGQDTREEIDVQQPTNPSGGENYGWRLREGTIANPTSGIGGPPPAGNVEPIFDYPHSTGQTVIGGYVYRGSAIPALNGTYVFGDYLGPEPGFTGKIFTLNYNGTVASNFQDITSELFPTTTGDALNNPSSLGEDAAGELYITDIGSGKVYKIVSTTSAPSITSVTRLESGSAFVIGSGAPFAAYTILASGNAGISFAPVASVTATADGTFLFEDAYAQNFPGRKYRVAPR